jgi:hypothetical protein
MQLNPNIHNEPLSHNANCESCLQLLLEPSGTQNLGAVGFVSAILHGRFFSTILVPPGRWAGRRIIARGYGHMYAQNTFIMFITFIPRDGLAE